jgi:siroheme synthase-like protein
MLYPVSLNLSGKKVLIIGGGLVAERKVESLLQTGASIRLISPEVTTRLQELDLGGILHFEKRRFAAGDCKDAFLVISATNDPQTQQAVWKEAEGLGILVNTVDESALCNVIMPAVVQRGDLTVAISTGGNSPALAVRLRERFTELLGPEYGRLLDLVGRARPEIQKRFTDINLRRELHYRIVDSNLLNLLRTNDDEKATQRLMEIIEEFERAGVPQ